MNPKTQEIVEVIQTMKEDHVYFGPDGSQWDRVFVNPAALTDTTIDPMSERNFKEKTGKKKMTLGDMWDKSKELSDMRISKLGHDPVKEKTAAEYKKKTKKDHPLL